MNEGVRGPRGQAEGPLDGIMLCYGVQATNPKGLRATIPSSYF